MVAPSFSTEPTQVAPTSRDGQFIALVGGGYAIIFEDHSPPGNLVDIVANFYDVDGALISSNIIQEDVPDNSYVVGCSGAALTNGGLVVIWANPATFFPGSTIYATRFDANGAQIGADITVAETGDDIFYFDWSVTATPSAGFAVTWDGYSDQIGNTFAKLRLFDAAGAPLAAEVQVGEDGDECPVVTRLYNGNLLLGFGAADNESQGYRLELRSATGALITADLDVVTPLNDYNLIGDIKPLLGGGFVVVWTDQIDGAVRQRDVYFQIYGANMAPVAGPVLVDSGITRGFGFANALVLEDGDIFIVYEREAAPITEPNNKDQLWGQRYNADGTPDGDVLLIAGDGTANVDVQTLSLLQDGRIGVAFTTGGASGVVSQVILEPSQVAVDESISPTGRDGHLIALAGGHYAVIFEDHSPPGNLVNMHVNFYDANSQLIVSNTIETNIPDNAYVVGRSGAALPNGDLIVIWANPVTFFADTTIYATRYDANGIQIGDDMVVTSLSGNQMTYFDWYVTPTLDGGFALAWDGANETTFDEFCTMRIFDAAGVPLGDAFMIGEVGDYPPVIKQLSDGNFIVGLSSGYTGSYRLEVRDATGALVTANLDISAPTSGGILIGDIQELPGGGFVVAWGDQVAGPQPVQSNYYVQFYDAAYQPSGPAVLVDAGRASFFAFVNAVVLDDGDIFVVYERTLDPVTHPRDVLYGQRLNPDGTPDGDAILIAGDGSVRINAPTVSVLADGRIGVAYTTFNNNTPIELFQAIIDPRTEAVSLNDGAGIDNNWLGTPYNDTMLGQGGNDALFGDAGNDTLTGGAGDDELVGGEGNDALRGDGGAFYIGPSGADTISGGAGNDTMWGGDGVDTFDGGEGADRVSFFTYAATQGAVANLYTQTISNDGYGNAESISSVENLGAGTVFADTFIGDDNANFMYAGLGDTTLGNGGDDTIWVDSAPANVDGGAGIDVIGFIGDISGSLRPDADDDGFAETVFAEQGVSVNFSTGMILNDGFGNSGTVTGFENVDGSELGDTIVGDDNANVLNGWGGDDAIQGRGGADTLIGGQGADHMNGGSGQDTASYANETDAMFVDLTAGTARRGSALAALEDTLVQIENVEGGAGDDAITGSSAANALSGNDGNDTITGAGGADTVSGGAGDDAVLYTIGNGADSVDGGADNDRLDIFGAATANTLNVVFDGAALTSFENGSLTGVETVTADLGAGVDTLNYGATTAAVTVALAAASASGFAAIVGIENVTGGAGDDTLGGDTLANTLNGGGGADTLDGDLGADTLIGGSGSDTASYASEGANMFINLAAGNTRRGSALAAVEDSLSSIENATGGFGNDTITGNNVANVLRGNSGADTIVGDGGADTIDGGGGDDTIVYTIGDGADAIDGGADNDTVNIFGTSGNNTLVVSFNGVAIYAFAAGSVTNVETFNVDLGGGVDTLNYADAATGISVNLAANVSPGFASIVGVENVIGSGSNDSLIGDGGANRLEGGAGTDTLTGGGGADVFVGGADGDTYYADSSDNINETTTGGIDQVLTASATFALSANVENLFFEGVGSFTGSGNGSDNLIVGGASGDTLSGAGGDDVLIGGGGNDALNGGAGFDRFVFTAGGGSDTITGFDANPTGGQDVLDVSGYGITGANFAGRVSVVDLGADMQITIDGSDVITLLGVNGSGANVITQDDFLLGS